MDDPDEFWELCGTQRIEDGFSDEISDSDESNDITDIKSKVKFLSATVEG